MGTEIILLSVVEKGPPLSPPIPGEVTPSSIEEPPEDFLKEAAELSLEEGEKLGDTKGVHIKKVIRAGDPVEEIIREAEESKADLIVIGSHGKSALGAALLGSVTNGVIYNKDTQIPALVVRR